MYLVIYKHKDTRKYETYYWQAGSITGKMNLCLQLLLQGELREATKIAAQYKVKVAGLEKTLAKAKEEVSIQLKKKIRTSK